MGESKVTEVARDRLAERIAVLADAATPEAAKTLAEAYSLVVHDPQGGSLTSGTEYSYTATTKQETDYHHTNHDRDRDPVGFSAPDK